MICTRTHARTHSLSLTLSLSCMTIFPTPPPDLVQNVLLRRERGRRAILLALPLSRHLRCRMLSAVLRGESRSATLHSSVRGGQNRVARVALCGDPDQPDDVDGKRENCAAITASHMNSPRACALGSLTALTATAYSKVLCTFPRSRTAAACTAPSARSQTHPIQAHLRAHWESPPGF